jgi:hypothetical protein
MSAIFPILGLAVCLYIAFRIVDKGFRNARESNERNERVYSEAYRELMKQNKG